MVLDCREDSYFCAEERRKSETKESFMFVRAHSWLKGKKCRKIYDTFVLLSANMGKTFLGRLRSFIRSCGRRSAQMDSFEIVVLRLKATKFHLDFLTAVSSFRKQ